MHTGPNVTAKNVQYVSPESAGTLAGLLRERSRVSPERLAYRDYDPVTQTWEDKTWGQMAEIAARGQAGLRSEQLYKGDRVAIMLRNCREWVALDQAALGLGLVVVPLYLDDRPENCAYMINDAEVRLVLFEGEEQWAKLNSVRDQLRCVQRFLSLRPVAESGESRLALAADWLPPTAGEFSVAAVDPTALATIVYTSGTTGRAKGVMLSHRNILTNAWAALQGFAVYPDDSFVSFLPLSHMLERTSGYYLPMMAGAAVAFARSVALLGEDLLTHKPTLLISVPRIYERVYGRINEQLAQNPRARKLFNLAVEVGWSRFEHRQGRGRWRASHLLWPLLERMVARKVMARLGGRLRCAISGGAALSPQVSRVFIGLGLTILQGYGLTETSPVLTACTEAANDPASVGTAAYGTELKIGDNSELLARSSSVMLGYWKNPEATRAVLGPDGWFHTGDQARIAHGYVYITGRLKDIIVLANGEKISPVDMELAITSDPLFEQVLVLGEGRPYLSALLLINREQWIKIAAEAGLGEGADVLQTDAAQALAVALLAEIDEEGLGAGLADAPQSQGRAARIDDDPRTREIEL